MKSGVSSSLKFILQIYPFENRQTSGPPANWNVQFKKCWTLLRVVAAAVTHVTSRCNRSDFNSPF